MVAAVALVLFNTSPHVGHWEATSAAPGLLPATWLARGSQAGKGLWATPRWWWLQQRITTGCARMAPGGTSPRLETKTACVLFLFSSYTLSQGQ